MKTKTAAVPTANVAELTPVKDSGRTQAYQHVRLGCPTCSKEPNCYKTTRIPGAIRRYYKCGWCGRIFKTLEKSNI
jgi:transposase-like protein